MARKVSVEIVGDSASVERAFGKASRSANGFNRSISTAEKGATRSFRGIAAGSGVFRSLGRSLAFASGGFLAFAGASAALRDSITGADSLEKAQKGLAVAIRHTGGNVDVLKKKYEATAQAAQQFGINQADATTGLERATVLTGDAVKAQRAYQEALVISKATGKDFNAVLTATSKGQVGVTTSLQRYGILIAKGTPGQKQFQTVMGRFAGQAKANTSGIDRFNATLQNTEAIIGTALLPVLNKYLGQLGRWLDKMDRSGQLQHDVNTAVHDGVAVFDAIGSVIKKVDRFTGSFKHTLELLLALKFASVAARWAGAFSPLIGARGAGGLLGAEGAAAGLEGRLAALSSLAPIAIPITLLITDKNVTKGVGSEIHNFVHGDIGGGLKSGLGAAKSAAHDLGIYRNGRIITPFTGIIPLPQLHHGQAQQTSPAVGKGSLLSGVADLLKQAFAAASGATPKTATATHPKRLFTKFSLPYNLQLQQEQASLTKTQTDDLAAARATVAYIKKVLAKDKLSHSARLAAIQAESGALGILWQAQTDAENKAKAAAQAAKQKAAAAAAKIKAAAAQYNTPLALQVADARAQALGLPDKAILLKIKKAALKAIRSGKKSLQGQLDAWNVIASVNDQLKSSATTGLNGFKQASTRALTANLGLTAAQRAELRARLSQRGPGGTVPGKGVGAGGYVIGANDRPIVIHHTTKLDGKVVERNTTRHQQRRERRSSHQRRGPHAGF